MKKPILFVNACVRKESRTRKLAEKLLIKMDQPYEEICLADISFTSVSEEYLNMRDHLIFIGDYQNPMFSLAQQFSEAGTIVIAAPYWDLSFPARRLPSIRPSVCAMLMLCPGRDVVLYYNFLQKKKVLNQ